MFRVREESSAVDAANRMRRRALNNVNVLESKGVGLSTMPSGSCGRHYYLSSPFTKRHVELSARNGKYSVSCAEPYLPETETQVSVTPSYLASESLRVPKAGRSPLGKRPRRAARSRVTRIRHKRPPPPSTLRSRGPLQRLRWSVKLWKGRIAFFKQATCRPYLFEVMLQFFIGLVHPATAWPFLLSMISINTIRDRKGPFRINDWMMDSGGGTLEIAQRIAGHADSRTLSFMIAVVRRFSSKTWRGSDIESTCGIAAKSVASMNSSPV
jgi:hypothetical protein